MNFAFIGTRNPTLEQKSWIEEVLGKMAYDHPDATLHTDAAPGTDQRAAGIWATFKGNVMLHLPWGTYEEDWVRLMERGKVSMTVCPQPKTSNDTLAKMHHNQWSVLSQGSQKMHLRNVELVKACENNLGYLFATPGTAQWGGGTAMGIKIARHLGFNKVEVFDPMGRDWSTCGC